MISPDDRKRKPYALPGQYVPYASVNQQQIRSVVTEVAVAMKNRGMHVIGKYIYNILYMSNDKTLSCSKITVSVCYQVTSSVTTIYCN